MYSLIRDEGKVKLCELYVMDEGYGYLPVSWWQLFKTPIMIIKDLIYQKKRLQIIPCGEFLEEQMTEMCLDYNQNYKNRKVYKQQ
jgi:hypothetical protein